MNDLDKVFASLNESGPEIGGGLPTHAEVEQAGSWVKDQAYKYAQKSDIDKKLTAPQIELVRASISSLPAQVSPQVKTILAQAARWLTFEELLQAYSQIISAGVTKTISITDVPVLNKSQTMRARKASEEE